MIDILDELTAWFERGEPVALATVVATWGSSPRGVGARMGITADGRMAGSVSGGCVEGAVVEAGAAVIESGEARLLHFGVSDETAWDVGLACGGTIDVFVQPLQPELFEALRSAAGNNRNGRALTIIGGSALPLGTTFVWADGEPLMATDAWDRLPAMAEVLAAPHARPAAGRMPLPGSDIELFAVNFQPPPRLVIIGGVHISIALSRMGAILGYETIIVDPRRRFGSRERFKDADHLIRDWPDEALENLSIDQNTAIAVLTHDPKLDDPALLVALRSPAFYIGALGSRKTQAVRRERLLKNGLTETEMDRLHGPIGLDIGARTPEEIALAVMGEIVAAAGKKH